MKKINLSTAINLLDVRRESREHQTEKWGLKAWGKFNGKDGFTWLNPSKEKLISTFESMPFPVFWLTTDDVLLDICQGQLHTFPNVKSIVLVANGSSVTPVFGATCTVAMFMEGLRSQELNAPNGIILISTKGPSGSKQLDDLTALWKNAIVA